MQLYPPSISSVQHEALSENLKILYMCGYGYNGWGETSAFVTKTLL